MIKKILPLIILIVFAFGCSAKISTVSDDEVVADSDQTFGAFNIVSNEKILEESLSLPFAAWSDDGESFVFDKAEQDNICPVLYMYNFDSGTVEEPNLTGSYPGGLSGLSPDGNWTASLSGTGDVAIVDNTAMEAEPILIENVNWFRESARCDDFIINWSPDSTRFYVVDGLQVFSVETFDTIFKVPSNSGWRWSPDGQKIAGIKIDRSEFPYLTEFYILDANGENREDIYATEFENPCVGEEPCNINEIFPAYGFGFDWSPDSQYIVYGSNGALYIIDLQTMETEILVSGEGIYLNPRWSADGQKILYEVNDQIWVITLGY